MTAPEASTDPLRILLVEDETLIALDMKDIMESAAYSVVGPAGRLDRALRLAADEPIDAAVLDINLGDVKIWPVAECLRQRGIPFILMSGLSSGSDVPASFAATPHVSKPVMSSELLEALAAAIKTTRLRGAKTSIPCA